MNRRQQTQASTSPQEERNRFDKENKFWLWAIFPGIFIAYLLLLTKNYYWDGIFFAQVIESAPALNPALLHPNHLIYNVFGYLVYQAARNLGFNPRAVEILQITNCFISALCAYVLFRVLLECFKSIYLSLALTLLFAFSATWWKFSTDADSYISSALFLLISFYLILPGRKPRPFLLAFAHTLSMLFHQLAILFFPVIVVGLYFQTSSQPAGRRIAPFLKYCLSAFLITLTIFFYSFYLIAGNFDFRPFLRWITNFSPEHGFTFNAWDNFVYTLRGHLRLFFGGRISLLGEISRPLMYAMVVIVFSLFAIFFFKLFRHFKEFKAILRTAIYQGSQFKSLRILCIVWIASYLLFLFFFIPQNTFYRLFYLPAIIVLGGAILAPYEPLLRGVRRGRALLFVAAMSAANLAFNTYPYAQIRANPPLALALELNKVWPPGTVIYLAEWNSDNLLVKYFNPATDWRIIKRETLEQELQNMKAGDVATWIDTTLINQYSSTPDGARWLEMRTTEKRELVNDKYKLRFYRLRSGSLTFGENHAPEQ